VTARVVARWSAALALATLALAGLARTAAASSVEDGTITYRVEHKLKTYEAVLPAASAQLEVALEPDDLEALQFSASIPLASFDSGNQLRDQHAAEALELLFFPRASWTVDSVTVVRREPADGALSAAELLASGPLELHGETVRIEARVLLTSTEAGLRAQARFDVSLEAFDIPRPGLLGIRIADTVTVTVDLTLGGEQP
jgi:polyisoprenoid-binding protein YceI